MKPIHFLLIVALLLLSIIIFLSTQNQIEGATGILHPTFESMTKSGSSVAEHPSTKWAGYLFGLAIIGIFCASILLSVKNNLNKRKTITKILAFFFLFAIVYTLSIISYWNYQLNPDGDFFLGFPKPTAWMLYGVFLFPVVLLLAYIFNFESWILSKTDKEEFEMILKNRQQKNI